MASATDSRDAPEVDEREVATVTVAQPHYSHAARITIDSTLRATQNLCIGPGCIVSQYTEARTLLLAPVLGSERKPLSLYTRFGQIWGGVVRRGRLAANICGRMHPNLECVGRGGWWWRGSNICGISLAVDSQLTAS